MNIEKLERRLERLKKQHDELELDHKGKELNFTYWAGFNFGYLKGKITEIEDIIDELKAENKL